MSRWPSPTGMPVLGRPMARAAAVQPQRPSPHAHDGGPRVVADGRVVTVSCVSYAHCGIAAPAPAVAALAVDQLHEHQRRPLARPLVLR